MQEKLIVVYGMSVDMQEILSSAKYFVLTESKEQKKSTGEIIQFVLSKCKGKSSEDVAIIMFEFGKWFERSAPK